MTSSPVVSVLDAYSGLLWNVTTVLGRSLSHTKGSLTRLYGLYFGPPLYERCKERLDTTQTTPLNTLQQFPTRREVVNRGRDDFTLR